MGTGKKHPVLPLLKAARDVASLDRCLKSEGLVLAFGQCASSGCCGRLSIGTGTNTQDHGARPLPSGPSRAQARHVNVSPALCAAPPSLVRTHRVDSEFVVLFPLHRNERRYILQPRRPPLPQTSRIAGANLRPKQSCGLPWMRGAAAAAAPPTPATAGLGAATSRRRARGGASRLRLRPPTAQGTRGASRRRRPSSGCAACPLPCRAAAPATACRSACTCPASEMRAGAAMSSSGPSPTREAPAALALGRRAARGHGARAAAEAARTESLELAALEAARAESPRRSAACQQDPGRCQD
mmetsp:Transcript_22964/g.61401  ORF Transcript_22964/g.61401 Transcript_22964/m.61401 type:complete len:299 (-) Transcript_22964:17-913(-)